MADTQVSEACAERHEGSTPSLRTKLSCELLPSPPIKQRPKQNFRSTRNFAMVYLITDALQPEVVFLA